MSIAPIVSESELGSYFVAAYPPFSCWRPENVDRFREALDAKHASPPPLGLYVHIPFCVERCHYCYYLSHSDKLQEIDAYLEALPQELSLVARTPALEGRELDFVYFGGGTPSLLSTSRIQRLVSGLENALPWSAAREVTFECAPKSVTERKCRALRDAGVTRISMGVQQLDDEVLKRNGRVHLTEDVVRAYGRLRHVGFPVINLDLIVGLVGETDASFLRSLDHVVRLAPDSITIYQLEIPLNTPLYRDIRDGKLDSPPVPWEIKRERLKQAFARLEESGYSLSSAYATVRDPERVRFVYQEEQYRGADLVGIGVSSFSYLGGVHQQNQATLAGYLEQLGSGRMPSWRAYALDDDERLVREFVLQLKLGGVDRQGFREKFGVDPLRRFEGTLAGCERDGRLVVDDEAITLTRDGLCRVDALIPLFYREEHQGTRYS